MNREEAINIVRQVHKVPLFVPCGSSAPCGSAKCNLFHALLPLNPGVRVFVDEKTGSFEIQESLPPTSAPIGTLPTGEVLGVSGNFNSTPAPESILQEAHRLTHGPRRSDYGHPLDDYNRTAALVSALLAHKLKEPLTADEMALAMVCVKLSRQVHFRKRDNTVDGAGYFWVAQECIDETERRKTT